MPEVARTESWLLPTAGILLFAGFTISIIVAFGTMDWRYLLITFGCWALIAAK